MNLFTTALMLTAVLTSPVVAGTPSSKYPQASAEAYAPTSLVTDNAEIRAAFEKLYKESPNFKALVQDIFQHDDTCPVVPVWAAHLSPDSDTEIVMHANGKTGNIYVDLNQIKRQGKSLSLVLAAQVKTFHEIFVEHGTNPKAHYARLVSEQFRSGGASPSVVTAHRFADRVRYDLGMPEQFTFPDPRLLN